MKTEKNFSVIIIDSDDEIPKCDKSVYIFTMVEGSEHFETRSSIVVTDDDEVKSESHIVLYFPIFLKEFQLIWYRWQMIKNEKVVVLVLKMTYLKKGKVKI